MGTPHLGMNRWRAGCGESRTSGSEGGSRKRAGGNAGTAPRSDPYTFEEDRSQVRVGSIPEVLAALRNTAISLLRLAGTTNLAATCRRHAAQPWEALALLGITRDN